MMGDLDPRTKIAAQTGSPNSSPNYRVYLHATLRLLATRARRQIDNVIPSINVIHLLT